MACTHIMSLRTLQVSVRCYFKAIGWVSNFFELRCSIVSPINIHQTLSVSGCDDPENRKRGIGFSSPLRRVGIGLHTGGQTPFPSSNRPTCSEVLSGALSDRTIAQEPRAREPLGRESCLETLFLSKNEWMALPCQLLRGPTWA